MSDINTYADEAVITDLTPINGDLVLNRANNSLYLCTDSAASGIARWKKFTNDSAAVPPLAIDVYDNESEFIDQTDAPDYTIVHAKDTDKLYVWKGYMWVVYDQN